MPFYTDDLHPDVSADMTRLVRQGHHRAVGAMILLIEQVIIGGMASSEMPNCTVRGTPLYVRYASKICGVFTVNAGARELVLLAMDLRSTAISLASSRV